MAAKMLKQIMDALSALRAPLSFSEYDLHALTAGALQDAGIEFVHEAPLKSRCRIDFLCGDTGIELKRGRPDTKQLKKQAERYLSSDRLSALIVVSERPCTLPSELLRKPVFQICLQRLWGIALDEPSEPVKPLPSASIQEEAAAFQDDPDAASGALTGGEEETPQEEMRDEKLSAFRLLESEEALNAIPLPAYLQDAPNAPLHYYGTLSYNKRAQRWVIKGEPCVTEMCKRLFPGSSGARRGEARFTAHRRIVGDIGWLMLRFPLAVAPQDEERWQETLYEAQNDYRLRELARVAPQAVQPPAAVFRGELKPFQQTGLAFLLRTKRALLADDMGLGKTVQALAALATLRAFPALLVVPPHLVLNWQAEIRRFVLVFGRPPVIHVIRGLTPYALPKADIYIIHYLLLRGWKDALKGDFFRAVVFDEIQELRRTGSEKYSAASLLSENCDRVYGLSGTPIYNLGGEIWNVVNILDFHFLGDYESFSREWCVGYGRRIVQKPELLGNYLRNEGLMLRRTKQEVLPELPEKRRLIQEIDADDTLYKTLMTPVLDKLHRWQTDTALTASERALLEDQISQQERQATGLAKAPYVCQFVRALCEAGERVLLFAHHHAVMDAYKKELKALHPVFITGRETAAQKEEACSRFMQDKTALCCVSLRAASGLNLQRATCVVFGELDWSPAVHSQAEDRAHRIGQTDSLLCYYLVSPHGSDSDIQAALGLKVSQFLSLMGDAPQSEVRRRQDASIARQHVEALVRRLSGSK